MTDTTTHKTWQDVLAALPEEKRPREPRCDAPMEYNAGFHWKIPGADWMSDHDAHAHIHLAALRCVREYVYEKWRRWRDLTPNNPEPAVSVVLMNDLDGFNIGIFSASTKSIEWVGDGPDDPTALWHALEYVKGHP